MNALEGYTLSCPYCGARIELTIDTSQQGQHYIEDCQVCCRPIEVYVGIAHSGELRVTARRVDY